METCNPPASPHSGTGSRGFSLVELMVVVAIIAILMGIAAPNIGQYIRNYKIRGAVNDVATNIQKARNRAVMKNANLGVTVVVQDATTYWVHLEDDQTPPRTMMVREPLDMAAAPTPQQTVQSTRYRLGGGETIRFASNAAECPTAPGGVFTPDVNGTYGLRFSRLGASCQPGTNCIDVTVVNGATLNVVHATAGGGGLMCVTDPVTGLSRWISISTGGRVAAQQ